MSDFAASTRRSILSDSSALADLRRALKRMVLRDPDLDAELKLLENSYLYDEAWYAFKYPLSRFYVGGRCLHYLKRGWKSGCSPGPNFDGPSYLQANPDVAAAGDYNPLLHYLRHGAAEGRVISVVERSEHLRDLEILRPGDWDEVEAQPTIMLRAKHAATVRVEFFPVPDYFRDPATAVPEGFLDVGLQAGEVHSCRCPVALDNKPYVVQVSNDKLHQVIGIKVNAYHGIAQDFPAFAGRQRKIFEMQRCEILHHCRTMMMRPHFTIILEDARSSRARDTLKSLRDQVYSDWSIGEPWNKGLAKSDCWIVCLNAGDKLEPDALYQYACEINTDQDLDLLYCDSVEHAPDGICRPFYKPAWSPDYLEAYNYIGRGAAFRIRRELPRGCVESYNDFVLRFTERDVCVKHLPHVLVALGPTPSHGFLSEGVNADAALKGRLERTKRHGEIVRLDTASSFFKMRVRPSTEPMVSIVIPTAGKTVVIDDREVDLLANVVENISARTSYPRYEIIVVDNGDLTSLQKQDLLHRDVRCFTYDEPDFNISKKFNLGAAHARGDLLLLMNDDIETLSPDWLSAMVAHFEKPHVGVVGVKLLYTDGSVQHVGVVQNNGDCDHVSRGLGADGAGYFGSASVVRNYCAVTGACIMMRRSTYRQVGGFSEDLAVSYNDIDFCFKIRSLGLTIVCDATIELRHFESRSRVPTLNLDELATFYARWSNELTFDPFYNERMLDVCPPSFSNRAKMRMI